MTILPNPNLALRGHPTRAVAPVDAQQSTQAQACQSRSFQHPRPSMDRVFGHCWGTDSGETTKWTRLQGHSLKQQKRLILKVCLLSVHVTFYLRGKGFAIYPDFNKKKTVGEAFIPSSLMYVYGKPRPSGKKLP